MRRRPSVCSVQTRIDANEHPAKRPPAATNRSAEFLTLDAPNLPKPPYARGARKKENTRRQRWARWKYNKGGAPKINTGINLTDSRSLGETESGAAHRRTCQVDFLPIPRCMGMQLGLLKCNIFLSPPECFEYSSQQTP
jgi:hypothetical protein